MKYTTSTLYDCFSSEKRVRLIVCLENKKCVSDLLTQCDLSQSALSQHLKILKDGGVVDCVRDGKRQIYRVINKNVLAMAKRFLELSS